MTVDASVRAEIGDLNARFAWALDLHEWNELHQVLAADVHYVSAGGREFYDAEAVVASFRARDKTRTTRHGLGNLLLHDEGTGVVRGRGSWHTFASNAPESAGVPLFMVADFHDTYRRGVSGMWQIAERLIKPVFRDELLTPPSSPGASR